MAIKRGGLGKGLDALMGHVGRAVERTGDAIARMADTLAKEPACPVIGEEAPAEKPAEETAPVEEPAPAGTEAPAAEAGAPKTEGPTVEDELRKALLYIRSRLDAPDAPSQPEMQALRQRLMDFARDVYGAFRTGDGPDKPQDDGNG